jgi:chromosome segregation ATPase
VIEEARRRVKEAEARAEDASAASATAAEEGVALRGKLEEAEARVREAEAERDSVREACAALEAEVERLSALHQEWQRQQGDGASAVAAQMAVLEQRNAELEGVVARSEREKEEVAALLEKQTEAVLELEKRVRVAESAAEGKGEELSRYVKAAEELGSIRGKLEVDLREKKAAVKEKEEEVQQLRARCDEVEAAVQKKTDTIKMIKAEADKSIQKHLSMLKEKESKIGDLEGALTSRDERIEAMAAMRDQQAAEVASLKELADTVPFLRQKLEEAVAGHQDGGVVQQELANLRETEAGLRSEVARLHGLLERAHSDLQSASSQVSQSVPPSPSPPLLHPSTSPFPLFHFSLVPRSDVTRT